MANGMMPRQLTPSQEDELQKLVKRTEAVHAFIEDNCEQIIFEQENKTDSRRNDIKAGDTDEDKTIQTSNRWNAANAAVAGQQEQDNHYCPEYEYDPVTEEEFDEFC